MSTYTVGYVVGNLSSTSINRVLSRALIRLALKDLQFTLLLRAGQTPLQPHTGTAPDGNAHRG